MYYVSMVRSLVVVGIMANGTKKRKSGPKPAKKRRSGAQRKQYAKRYGGVGSKSEHKRFAATRWERYRKANKKKQRKGTLETSMKRLHKIEDRVLGPEFNNINLQRENLKKFTDMHSALNKHRRVFGNRRNQG